MRFDAYLFDVQGTLLDFFTPVTQEVAAYLSAQGRADVDPADFTRRWRDDYFARVSQIAQPQGEWVKVQSVYGAGLVELARSHELPVLSVRDAQRIASSWQRMVPWPDVPEGLDAVRAGAMTATLSNTDMSTVITLAKRHRLQFDAYLTAELFRRFKPHPSVYLGALEFLGVDARRAVMVASHPYDLDAAAALGMGTVYVERPYEYGDSTRAVTVEVGRYTQVVTDIGEIR